MVSCWHFNWIFCCSCGVFWSFWLLWNKSIMLFKCKFACSFTIFYKMVNRGMMAKIFNCVQLFLNKQRTLEFVYCHSLDGNIQATWHDHLEFWINTKDMASCHTARCIPCSLWHCWWLVHVLDMNRKKGGGGGVGWLGLHILNEKYSISQLGDKTPPWTCNTSWCFLCTALYHGNTPA